MAAGASPTIYDPKALAQAILTTTLTTTLVTAPAEAGVKIERIVLCNYLGTGASANVTLDHYDGSTGWKIMSAAAIPGDGYPVVLELGIYLDSGDLLRGGCATATAVQINAYGIEMKD